MIAMAKSNQIETQQSQSDKFKEAARELGADEDEKAWDERLTKVVKPKPEREPKAK